MEPINEHTKSQPEGQNVRLFRVPVRGCNHLVGTGVVDAFFPDLSDQVGQVTTAISSAVALVIGGALGVAYRPASGNVSTPDH